ncbi:MAG TPA: ABC transporter ATP-binding protein [Feifaniaceae bacterium]|nr:ABC transporter ATP-binding protein [Feifaniaceae bacterium]
MTLLEVKDLTVRYGALTILDKVSFSLEEDDWLMLVGPNGAGKSTIVNAVSQGAPYSGEVRCLGKDVRRYRSGELAKCLGVLSQTHTVGYAFTVESVVRLGRYAYAPGVFGGARDEDDAAVRRALELTGMTAFAHQSVLTLSGGELQRTFLAQLFAQNPRVLILDEPTNHLDLVYQKQVFELIANWLKTPGRAVVSVVHDLSLAKAYGTHALLLNHGKTVAQGTLEEVFTPEHLNSAYDMDVSEWMRTMLSQWPEA